MVWDHQYRCCTTYSNDFWNWCLALFEGVLNELQLCSSLQIEVLEHDSILLASDFHAPASHKSTMASTGRLLHENSMMCCITRWHTAQRRRCICGWLLWSLAEDLHTLPMMYLWEANGCNNFSFLLLPEKSCKILAFLHTKTGKKCSSVQEKIWCVLGDFWPIRLPQHRRNNFFDLLPNSQCNKFSSCCCAQQLWRPLNIWRRWWSDAVHICTYVLKVRTGLLEWCIFCCCCVTQLTWNFPISFRECSWWDWNTQI